jgi:hypothetical protein
VPAKKHSADACAFCAVDGIDNSRMSKPVDAQCRYIAAADALL